MNKFAFTIALLCLTATITDARGNDYIWHMECDNGRSIAIEEVDYLMRSDDTVTFSIVLKNNEIINNVKSISFAKEETSGIETVTDKNNTPICFPNPVSHTLYIKGMSDGEQGSIVSIDGKIVKEFNIENTEISLPVYDLPTGTYFIKTKTSVLKFLKQ